MASNLLAMASNLLPTLQWPPASKLPLAMASNLLLRWPPTYYCDGLQPTCDGLQPSCDGLQPNSKLRLRLIPSYFLYAVGHVTCLDDMAWRIWFFQMWSESWWQVADGVIVFFAFFFASLCFSLLPCFITCVVLHGRCRWWLNWLGIYPRTTWWPWTCGWVQPPLNPTSSLRQRKRCRICFEHSWQKILGKAVFCQNSIHRSIATHIYVITGPGTRLFVFKTFDKMNPSAKRLRIRRRSVSQSYNQLYSSTSESNSFL